MWISTPAPWVFIVLVFVVVWFMGRLTSPPERKPIDLSIPAFYTSPHAHYAAYSPRVSGGTWRWWRFDLTKEAWEQIGLSDGRGLSYMFLHDPLPTDIVTTEEEPRTTKTSPATTR